MFKLVFKYWILRFDTELDKNQDNLLSKEEILAWIIPSNEDIASEEVIFKSPESETIV